MPAEIHRMEAFERLAEHQIPAPRRARLRVFEKRPDKARAEQERQLVRWRAWCREREESLFNGTHADAARKLAALLNRLNPDDGDALIAAVIRGQWRQADDDTRYLVLALVDNAIVEMRERNGLRPFCDPLPGEPLNVFAILREALA